MNKQFSFFPYLFAYFFNIEYFIVGGGGERRGSFIATIGFSLGDSLERNHISFSDYRGQGCHLPGFNSFV